jgi:hypothetical protein
MNDKRGENTAASVRDRLLALARERGEDFQLLLTQYGLERLLYRLSKSGYRDRFILKGAMLFMLWGNQPHRPTRDVDFLGFGDSSEAGLQVIFRELCDIPVEDDGLAERDRISYPVEQPCSTLEGISPRNRSGREIPGIGPPGHGE